MRKNSSSSIRSSYLKRREKVFVTHKIAATILIVALAASVARSEITGTTRIASGLSQPIFATHAPGDTSRLFIVERTGSIRIFDRTTGSLIPQPFLSGLNVAGLNSEGGLFAMAFHPNYQTNGKFYISATFANGGLSFQGASAGFSSHVREYQVSATDPNVANTTFNEVINWVQPQGNHNGGWIGFSPNDNYLYIGSGDGGGGNDNATNGHTPGTGNAQDITDNFHGKMLRINVDADDFADTSRNYAIPPSNPFVGVTGDDEIWAYGLRNPWRSSFDRETGDLWIGDVGQGAREEIDFQAADSTGGENYGWRIKEASLVTGLTPGASTAGLVDPIYEYTRGTGALQGRSVTGGYVYRGADNDVRGDYIFGDYITSNIWRYNQNNTPIIENINSDLVPNVGSIGSVASFGEDADGNLYVLDLFGGEVFRIDTDIMIEGDYDGSGTVDAGDYILWRTQFGSTGTLAADGNHNGVVDAADYTVWRDNLGRSFVAGAVQTGAVPEPTALAAGVVFLVGFVGVRRRLAH